MKLSRNFIGCVLIVLSTWILYRAAAPYLQKPDTFVTYHFGEAMGFFVWPLLFYLLIWRLILRRKKRPIFFIYSIVHTILMVSAILEIPEQRLKSPKVYIVNTSLKERVK